MEDRFGYYAEGYSDGVNSETLRIRRENLRFRQQRRREDGITKALVAIPFLALAYYIVVYIIMPFYHYYGVFSALP